MSFLISLVQHDRSVPISEKTLESTNTIQIDSDKNMINFEKSFCDVRKTLNDENTNPFQSASVEELYQKFVHISQKHIEMDWLLYYLLYVIHLE
jgi:hypothetical protein